MRKVRAIKFRENKKLVAKTAQLLKAEPSGSTSVRFLRTLLKVEKITEKELDEIFQAAEAQAYPRVWTIRNNK